MDIKIIVAVDEKWAIGKNNNLLFSIPEDMKHFKSMTLGNIVISGKNNLLSFPDCKPLVNRRNIILSTSLKEGENYEVVRSLEELFNLLKDEREKEIYVIGGSEVYIQMLPYCSTAYITKMYMNFEGEKFFPILDNITGWELRETSEIKEYKGLKFCFTKYENNLIKTFDKE